MDAQKELLDAMQILIDKSMSGSTQIIFVTVTAVATSTATVTMNGKSYTLPFYGTTPTLGKKCPLFIPNGNMSMAFIIG